MSTKAARLRAFADACDPDAAAEITRELAGRVDDAAVAVGAAIGAAYPAMRGLVLGRPDAVAAIAREGWRSTRKKSEMLRRLLVACGGDVGDIAAVRRGLRRGTAAERLRIALRELEPDIDMDVVSREWSDLAEAQLEIALLEARMYVERRYGLVRTAAGDRNGFVVLGLGKLGGGELNAGSDVDVMFLHESDEGDVWIFDPVDPSANSGPLENGPPGALARQPPRASRVPPDLASSLSSAHPRGTPSDLRPFDAFTKIAQRLVVTIDAHDDDGFCARMDLRLRPEGSGGPLVNSHASAATYYETFGRAWERAALLRARPVAGDLDVGTRALAEIAPFIYRRTVDPSITREMHDMARRARVELSDAPARDLKLGPGGIREAEFFVQSLQLVWGGKDPSVRSPNTLDGLRRLRARGYVTDREARGIADGYPFLRRVEHRVQLASGLHTHVLPPDGPDRDRIARSLGFRSGAELWGELERVRGRIVERFASLVPGGLVGEVDARIDAVFRALDPDAEAHTPTGSTGGDLAAQWRALARRPDGPLGSRTRERHARFARALVGSILDAADPELAAGLVRTFFDRLALPSIASYVRALEQDDKALSRFVGLCGASAYLGGSLVGHPELVDLLLFATRSHGADPGRGARVLAEEIAHLTHAERKDTELFVGAMRRAKATVELEVGLADLAGELDIREAGRTLSSIAEATVEEATGFALEEMSRRRALKSPGGGSATLRGLAVLAMGKLGGREIGYGSDLDVVFVYDPRALDDVGVDRLEAGDIYGRVAARVIRLIGTPHEGGPGYELDTRLRPSGEQGHLVVSFDAFCAYHLPNDGSGTKGPRAADWERQALLRLRPCAGDAGLCADVAVVAATAAYEREPVSAEQLLRLRARLELEVGQERTGRFDVKLGRGGIADIEFAVQLLQMRHGRTDMSLRTTETPAAIDALDDRGHLDHAHATTLRDGYRFLRKLEQRARVVHGARTARLEDGAPGLIALARSMGYRDSNAASGGSVSEQLLATYQEVTAEVRATFADIVRD